MSACSSGEPTTASPSTRSIARRLIASAPDVLGERLERRADARVVAADKGQQPLAAALDVEHGLGVGQHDVGAGDPLRAPCLAIAARPRQRRAVGLRRVGCGQHERGRLTLARARSRSTAPGSANCAPPRPSTK